MKQTFPGLPLLAVFTQKGTKLRRGRHLLLLLLLRQGSDSCTQINTHWPQIPERNLFVQGSQTKKKTLKIHLFTFCLRFLLWKFSGVSSSMPACCVTASYFVLLLPRGPQSQEAQRTGRFLWAKSCLCFDFPQNVQTPPLFFPATGWSHYSEIVHRGSSKANSCRPFFLPLRRRRRWWRATTDSF